MSEFPDFSPAEFEPERTPRAMLDGALRRFDDTLHVLYPEWEHAPTEEFRLQSQDPTKVGWTFTFDMMADHDEPVHPRLSRIKGTACEIITYFPEVIDDEECIQSVPATPYSQSLKPEAAMRHMGKLLSDLTEDLQSGVAVAKRVGN